MVKAERPTRWLARGELVRCGPACGHDHEAPTTVDPAVILAKIVNDPMGYVEPSAGVFDCRVETLTAAEIAYLEAMQTDT